MLRACPDTPLHGAPPCEGTYLHELSEWLNRLLAWHISVTRQTYGALADDEYRGLYIPDVEADLLCAAPPEIAEPLRHERAALAQERQRIAARAETALHNGDEPLLRLAQLFGLTAFAQDVLLVALAPELDVRYERLYAYIQDDVTKKRPTVDLALRLLCTSAEERHAARADFAADAPLLQHRLIQVIEEGQRSAPLIGRFMKMDDRIVAELLVYGQATQDERRRSAPDVAIAPFVTVTQRGRSFDTLILAPELVTRLRRAFARRDEGLVLALQGSYGSGRRAIAEALCAEAGMPLLTVNLDALADGESIRDPDESMRRIIREALLHNAAILWQAADRLLHDDAPNAWRAAVLHALDEYRGCSFLALERPWEARGAFGNTHFQRIALPTLSYGDREQIWRVRLNGDRPDDTTVQALASTFRLSGGQIRDAVAMARALAQWGGSALDSRDLYAACRAQSSGKLDSLAHKISATYGWNDIVLPSDQIGQLQEVCIQVRHRSIVLEQWGFDRHLAMGKGVNVLFAGPSGTGKTMAAEIIATDLGLELYKVDLSTMVSKYIGETEKNLDRVFTAAREANAILFFDEADALFGKRSEVKDAHDRYANIEVGYLLQKMEEYDGVVILATNLRKNLDDAFVRRLHVAIDFPFPEESDRLRIWRKVFPPDAPLAASVDLAFLAKQFKLAGGNIRNIALLAAYLAAEDGAVIEMAHVMRAIKREYQKLGKLVTTAEFGRWLPVAKGTL